MKQRRSSRANASSDGDDSAHHGRYHTKKFEKHTPAYKFMSSRLFSNLFIFLGAVTIAYYVDHHFRSKGLTFADTEIRYETAAFVPKDCTGKEASSSPCRAQQCGRFVVDNLLTDIEVTDLTSLAQDIMQVSPGGSGGPTILDLHSGALSYKDRFINIYPALSKQNIDIANHKGFTTYKAMRERVQAELERVFNVQGLHLTKPTFFSRIGNKTAQTEHDEYWHEHVDRITYGSFDYTCLLYLSDYGTDFEGGRFAFDDQDWAHNRHTVFVEPIKGRLSCFTSGAENSHHVEQVTSGTRFALTYGFTCAAEHAIPDPSGQAAITTAAVPDHIESP
eukprot:TRINITY_DN14518_c0_g1_i1.p1 TRINITY_DN14518_c0_g1~~TRINITY_DN14518_c0_g1_i1.p1  ORF type:complete len:334 (+),score=76.28 TRINITY_DN14518_c0_g1_i1:236-1237(+)